MVLQTRRAVRRRLYRVFACVLASAVLASACDKAPLLAPGGTVIFLTATSSSMSANGSIEIIAVLLEQGTAAPDPDSESTAPTPGSGTPVHNGTVVNFTSTIGRIEPAEARTENGRVVVKFIGDGRSGAANILAYSGGARSEIEVAVGGAAADHIVLSTTPVSSSGGKSTISAKVEDASGNPLSGVVVQFTATTGSLSANSASTNDAGVASVTLTATTESEVTATVGTKTATAKVTPATRSGLSITPPSTLTASSPAIFTFTTTNGATVKNVKVNWGDGQTQNLGVVNGSMTATHTYGSGGNYNVTAAATMNDNSVEPSVASPVSVGEFTVTLSSTGQEEDTPISFVAAVSPNTTNVDRYEWDFGDPGSTNNTMKTDGNSAQHVFETAKNYTVTVRVIPVTGSARSTTLTILVSSSGG